MFLDMTAFFGIILCAIYSRNALLAMYFVQSYHFINAMQLKTLTSYQAALVDRFMRSYRYVQNVVPPGKMQAFTLHSYESELREASKKITRGSPSTTLKHLIPVESIHTNITRNLKSSLKISGHYLIFQN